MPKKLSKCQKYKKIFKKKEKKKKKNIPIEMEKKVFEFLLWLSGLQTRNQTSIDEDTCWIPGLIQCVKDLALPWAVV